LRLIAWSLHSRDTFSRDPQATAQRVLARIRPGDIVLFHDGHEHRSGHRRAALEALSTVLQGLKGRGLRSVTVSQLLGRNV
jgi:peptidoglycan/xylan/chitin deacetylase (PgdA/CDA1 family)